MRVLLLTETFTKNMGYIGSMLPKYLARMGVEVHVVTLDLMPYYALHDHTETFSRFEGFSPSPAGTVEQFEGYTIHTQRHVKLLGYMAMEGILKKLWEIKPDVVYSVTAIGWLPLFAALARPLLRFKLFTGSHSAASTFPLARTNAPLWDKERIKCFLTRAIHGRLVSLMTERCYCPTIDCADIAHRFFGIQKKKVEVLHLGVDTEFFFPVRSEEDRADRERVRELLGVAKSDILCIYTGKLTKEKNAVIIAQAIQVLREQGYPFQALFIGNGVQWAELQGFHGCRTLEFMHYQKLGSFYRSADIAVWPTNESTSMLDAAACGIPIVVSDGIVYRDHVDDNGLVFRMNDLDSLVSTLKSLTDPSFRANLGEFGAHKMLKHFSWEARARKRFNDFCISFRQDLDR